MSCTEDHDREGYQLFSAVPLKLNHYSGFCCDAAYNADTCNYMLSCMMYVVQVTSSLLVALTETLEYEAGDVEWLRPADQEYSPLEAVRLDFCQYIH